MNRFQSLMRDIAGEASPPPDLAERALARARKRRVSTGMPVIVAAAASVVVVLGGTIMVPRLLPGVPGWADSLDGGQQISFPEQAEALPEEGVAPAVLAYQPACDEPAGADCEPWRIMTVDNEHYELPTGRTGPAQGEEVAVSPSGDRLAYWRPDGKVVLHTLDSGKTKEQFGWDGVEPVSGSRFAWSQDGRWLLGVPGPASCEGNGCGSDQLSGNAKLVDTEAHQAYDVGSGPEVQLGDLSNGDDPSVLGGVSGSARDQGIDLDADHQLVMYGIDAEEIQGASADPILGSTSPDGSRLATITFPEERDDASPEERGDASPEERDNPSGRGLVSIVDLTEKEVVQEFRIDAESARWGNPHFLGWQDDNHVLIGARASNARDSDDPAASPRTVESFDIRSGSRETVLKLPDGPARFDLAIERL